MPDKKDNPTASVILPTRNGSAWIRTAIQSVLNQSFADFELIVLDDGSTDKTADIVLAFDDPRIRLLRNDVNIGIQRTLNRGLKESRGKMIARIDDDDEWIDSKKLEKQILFFNENPGYVLLGTSVIVSNEGGEELFKFQPPCTDGLIRAVVLSRNCFTHSSVVFLKDVTLKFGGYSEDEAVRHLEDYDLWLKLGTVGRVANLPDYSVRFTLRSSGLSSLNRGDQYRRDIALIRRFRASYPNYTRGVIIAYLRLFGYRFLKYIPFRNLLLRIYKSR